MAEGSDTDAMDDIKEFVKCYGAYLQLHTCIAYAAAIEAEGVIHVLLDLAKHDPRHLEAMKQLSKSNALVLYDPVSYVNLTCKRNHLFLNSFFSLVYAVRDYPATASHSSR